MPVGDVDVWDADTAHGPVKPEARVTFTPVYIPAEWPMRGGVQVTSHFLPCRTHIRVQERCYRLDITGPDKRLIGP